MTGASSIYNSPYLSDEMMENIRIFSKPPTYHRPAPKIGRNAPCPCNSGKKYKYCCLNKDA